MSTKPPERIEWSDPPPKETRTGSRWDPVAKALKSRPGVWACIGRGIATSIVTDINRGTLKCFRPAGTFEAVTRDHLERWKADVYARYVGDDREYADDE